MTDVEAPVAPVAADRQDERLREDQGGVAGAIASVKDRVQGGDLGVIPVVVGLIVIAVVLQSLNSTFLSSRNLTNLLMECVPVGVIALGIVCILLVAEIDLSVGSVSGLSSALLAVFFVDKGLPAALAILIALLAGALIGVIYSQIFTRVGVPSFVITLSGLLAFQGLQLYLLGTRGAINLPFDSEVVKFAQLQFVPQSLAFVLVLVAGLALFATGFARARARRDASLSAQPVGLLAAKAIGLVVVLGLAVAFLYSDGARGVGWMFVFFLVLVLVLNYALTRTKWGKSMFAVGGNAEAARRAGIDVNRVYLSAFVLCSTFAAAGGVLAASRLAAANQSSGGGDVNLNAIAAAVIGGTSLFGGRGSAFAALLGILVIQSISNGLTLLSLDSSYRFMVTGAVLLLAVCVDSVARRTRASSGR